MELIKRTFRFVMEAFDSYRVVFAFIINIITWVLFPVDTYYFAVIAVVVASALDIGTKWWAICRRHGGYLNAIKAKKLSSTAMWEGTQVKIVAYLVVMILTGLSYRVVFLDQASIFIGSFVYSVLFMREFQSNIENLVEGGAKLEWLLLFSKKKTEGLLKDITPETTKGEHDGKI